MHVVVVGGGIFGVTASLAFRRRGFAVTVVEPALPHPLAESTDISKVVRMDYGADVGYTQLGEQALEGWRRWNAAWTRPLFHETGVTFLAKVPMAPGGFEHDSYAMLTSRGHALERLDADAIADRFPAYRRGVYVDGYFNPQGGWAESGAVVAQLAAEARAAGITLRTGTVTRVVDEGVLIAAQDLVGAPRDVEHGREAVREDELLEANLVVICSGSWVPLLVPELAPMLRAVGQPVFHLRPADPAPFAAHQFPVFGADISRTGFYGFPVNRDGIVKVANHGTGTELPPGSLARDVSTEQERNLRAMLADSFPRSPTRRSSAAGSASTAIPSTRTSGSRAIRRDPRSRSRPAAPATHSSSRPSWAT